jgi:hypothetical protein
MEYVAVVALFVGLGTVFWAWTEFTKTKFAILNVAVGVFCLSFPAVAYVQDKSLNVWMILAVCWLWGGFFYAFGMRYITRRGFSQGPIEVDLDAFANDSERKSFANILKVCQHVLGWSMVALLTFIVIKGLLGYGWITKLN